MKRTISIILLILVAAAATAQTREVAQRTLPGKSPNVRVRIPPRAPSPSARRRRC